MTRTIEYHVTVAVPVVLHDDGTFKVGEPYPCEMGTPLNADTYDCDAEEWFELHRQDLPGDADSGAIAEACYDAVFLSDRNDRAAPLATQLAGHPAAAANESSWSNAMPTAEELAAADEDDDG